MFLKVCADFLAENYKINSLDGTGKFSKTQMYHSRSVRVLADYFNSGTFFQEKVSGRLSSGRKVLHILSNPI